MLKVQVVGLVFYYFRFNILISEISKFFLASDNNFYDFPYHPLMPPALVHVELSGQSVC